MLYYTNSNMDQNKPLPRPPSYYFKPIYNKKDIKCEDTEREEEKLLDPIKLLKPKVRIPSPYPYPKSAKVYPETIFSEINNTPSSNNLTSKL